jgi:putative radical SAM enzyme (TIGR03279 family)
MADKVLEIIKLNDPSRFGLRADILSVGDVLIEISGRPSGDQLDFHYYASADQKVLLKVRKKNGTIEDVSIDTDILHKLDLTFSPMDFKRCRCKCPFCFVDQMPPGMRDTLYLKDEDFRLSFLYGNFTTLNDITNSEIDRIIEQGISPQYVSVHAVDPAMREWIFGRPMKRDILNTLHRLADGGITIHAQAVLCPGRNDGTYLDETISSLETLHSNIASLAVVPVGLTGHREGLPPLRTYRAEEMLPVITQVEDYQRRYLDGERVSRFVFLSDEWFIETDSSIPEEDAYEGYPQLDNGVGMTRNFVNEIIQDIEDLGMSDHPGHILIVTGELGAKVFSKYVLPIFSELGRPVPTVIKVTNHFFGETVTTSGLLSSTDIIAELNRLEITQGTIFLPPNVLNYEDKFLDGPSLDDFRHEIKQPVIVPRESFIGALQGTDQQEGEAHV